MDMIFGVFSETDARLLKKYNLCFWSLAKTQAMLSLSNTIELYKSFLEWP